MCLGNKEIMSMNIKHYMELKGVDRMQLSEDLNVSYTTISDWINAKTYPRIDKIELMANYFGVDKSSLVEKRTEERIANDNALRIAAHIDDNVTEEQMNDIIRYIEFLKSQQPKE